MKITGDHTQNEILGVSVNGFVISKGIKGTHRGGGVGYYGLGVVAVA